MVIIYSRDKEETSTLEKVVEILGRQYDDYFELIEKNGRPTIVLTGHGESVTEPDDDKEFRAVADAIHTTIVYLK